MGVEEGGQLLGQVFDGGDDDKGALRELAAAAEVVGDARLLGGPCGDGPEGPGPVVDALLGGEEGRERDEVLGGEGFLDDEAEGEGPAVLLGLEVAEELVVAVEDDEGGGGAAGGGREARGYDAREGAAPGRDVGLVAIWVEGSLGLEVGV